MTDCPPEDPNPWQIRRNDAGRNVHHSVILQLDLAEFWHIVKVLVKFLLKVRVGDPAHSMDTVGQALSLGFESKRGCCFQLVDVEEEEVVDVPVISQQIS
jgi:hypothetical protein